ncbi:hypothetical protein EVAR_11858_1 [Eumeta japonica]|uniref:Uncharacterized protein n=1 Tax=Eumeta variegata TaxID=151549 RepID=A0A4C1U7G6_EUMVA|nr:hypothetical protein EVAR_11858_1 [Eumeta japonica]
MEGSGPPELSITGLSPTAKATYYFTSVCRECRYLVDRAQTLTYNSREDHSMTAAKVIWTGLVDVERPPRSAWSVSPWSIFNDHVVDQPGHPSGRPAFMNQSVHSPAAITIRRRSVAVAVPQSRAVGVV